MAGKGKGNFIEYDEFVQYLKVSSLSPVIVLFGSDRYLKKKILQAVEEKLGGERKVEKEIFYAPESSADEVLNSLQTYSMFSPNKMVLVYQFQAWKENQRNELLDYYKGAGDRAVLVLIAEDPPSDYQERKRYIGWFESIDSQVPVVNLWDIDSEKAKTLIKEIVKDWGKRITEPTIDLLVELLGSKPELIYLELEKISLYLGEGKVITPELVSELVMGSRLQNIFEMTEALGKRDPEQSLKLYRKMQEEKQVKEMLLGIIKRHFRILIELQAVLGSNQLIKKVLDRYRVPAFFHKQYQSQAERFSQKELIRAFEEFYLMERRIKSSAIEQEAIMENLLLRLIKI